MTNMGHHQALLPAGLRLDRPLAGGGLGDVFEATDTRAGGAKRVVQFLPPAAAPESWHDWPAWKPRLEAWLAARCGRELPHVSFPLETGATPSGLFVVSFAHDHPLPRVLAERPEALRPAAALAIVEQLLAGLAEMHARGLVHGDVRPRNVYLTRLDADEGEVTARLDDSLAGALAAWSNNGVEDANARIYRSLGALEAAATLSPQEDLRALALTACELALGGQRALLEHADGARSVDEFWGRIEPEVRQQLARQGRGTRLRTLFAGTNPARRLLAMTSILLDGPPPKPLGVGWLGVGSALSPRQTHVPVTDAGDSLRRLRAWDAARLATERRVLAAVFLVALVGLASASYLGARGWDDRAKLAEAQRTATQAVEQLDHAKADVHAREKEIDDLKRQIDEKIVKQKNEELREIRKQLEDIRKQMAGAPPPSVPNTEPVSAEIGRRAQAAWKQRVSVNHPYNPNEIKALFEKTLGKDRDVAERIKQWKEDVDSLRRRAKPWLTADTDLKRFHDSALAQPWEDALSSANHRLEILNRAAKKWTKWAEEKPQDSLRPNLAASLGSYLTISRYGDIALRSFAYFKDDERAFLGETDQLAHSRPPEQNRYGYRRWRVEALCVLCLLIVGFPLATGGLLAWQASPFGTRGRDGMNSVIRRPAET